MVSFRQAKRSSRSQSLDEPLERRISRILAEPNHYDYPKPESFKSRYGYMKDRCPACGHECLKRGGYKKHYTLVHAPDMNRIKAKKIIKAVRSLR